MIPNRLNVNCPQRRILRIKDAVVAGPANKHGRSRAPAIL